MSNSRNRLRWVLGKCLLDSRQDLGCGPGGKGEKGQASHLEDSRRNKKNRDILRLVISESRMDLDAIVDTGEKVGIQIDFFDVETFEHGDAL
jgi:hypothetical protein